MPRHERLVRELERATATPNLASEEDVNLIDEESSLPNGPGRSAMESEIDELLAGGHFGSIPSIPEEVQETTDDGLQVARGSQRHLLVGNSLLTEMELLSNFDEVIWYKIPISKGTHCSASRLADNLFLTAAHCLHIPDVVIGKDSPVASICEHPDYKPTQHIGYGAGAWHDSNYDLALMSLIDSEFFSGRTVQLSGACPTKGDTQRIIGSGLTSKMSEYPNCNVEQAGVQRSGIGTVKRMEDNEIILVPVRWESKGKNRSYGCRGDSGGFLGYLDDESGQLSQTGVFSADPPAGNQFSAVCGNSLGGDWVRNVSHSDWASNPNCRYLKYQEPVGPKNMPLHGPIDRPVNEGRRAGKRELLSLQLPDEARQESFGSPMQSSNRGPGMAGMGLMIGIPLLLLILYLMNKFSRTKNTDKAQSEQN